LVFSFFYNVKRIFSLVTSFADVEKELDGKFRNMTVIRIPGRYGRHYRYVKDILSKIEEVAKLYDVFLVGGGVYGRLYSNHIKACGKIAIDIGQVFDVWSGYTKHPPSRLQGRLVYDRANKTFSLTDRGRRFKSAI